MLLAGEPRLPALLLAVGPGPQAVLLGSGQVGAHILVSVEDQVLQQASGIENWFCYQLRYCCSNFCSTLDKWCCRVKGDWNVRESADL